MKFIDSNLHFMHVIIYTCTGYYFSTFSLHIMSFSSLDRQTRPLKSWANKYSQRSNGIPTEKVAPYGRQILEVDINILCYCKMGKFDSENVGVRIASLSSGR